MVVDQENFNDKTSSPPFFLAITGGKGGTGKTLICSNLALLLQQKNAKILLIDCDVDNPNTNILFSKQLTDPDVREQDVSIFQPSFIQNRCTQCKICQEACYRHAILQFPGKYPLLMEHMCSGCRTCQRVCPEDAIENSARIVGKQYFIKDLYPNLDLLVGELKPSEAVSILVVESILKYATTLIKKNGYDYVVIDTSPGAHCDVERVLMACDLILCVTEPTPFGAHDLKRILELIQIIGKPAYILLNRSDLTEYREEILEIQRKNNVPIIGEIPIDRLIMENYARGHPFVLDPREFPGKTAMYEIFHHIFALLTKKHPTEEI